MRVVAARVLARMQQGALAGALTGWWEFTQWSVRSKALLDRQLMRWTQQSVLKAFSSWAASTSSALTKKHGLRKIVIRIQQQVQSAAFEAWAIHTQDAQRLAAAASRSSISCLEAAALVSSRSCLRLWSRAVLVEPRGARRHGATMNVVQVWAESCGS